MKHKLTISLIITVVSVLFASCGLRDATYINYKPADDSTCQEGLDSFSENISSAADGTCAVSGCHDTTTIKGATLTIGGNEANRKALLSYIEGDGTNLFNKIGQLEGLTHGGKDKSADLPLATIQKWMAVESACTSE